MGLVLPQEIDTKWVNFNKQHFINKGYVYTGYNDKITVNVLDLPDMSAIKVKVVCDYCGETFLKTWCQLKNLMDKNKKVSCSNCCCRDMSDQRLSHDEYCEKLDNKSTIIPIAEYIKSNVAIMHKCLLCGYESLIEPYRVLRALKNNINCCKYCNKLSVTKGGTDLWATHPHIAKLLENPEDGYKYRYGSSDKLNWRCDECGTVVHGKYLNNVIKFGVPCPLCKDGFSTGFKYVCAILSELGVDYSTEKSFTWINDKYYDIYIPRINAICEIHGAQHYTQHGFGELGGRTLAEEIENDNYKMNSAISNGIAFYIVIDARKSTLNHLKESVINSELAKLFDLSQINFQEVYAKALSSYVVKVCDFWNKGLSISNICKEMNISDTTTRRYLHIGTDAGICTYKGLDEKLKPVVCLNTGERFKSLDEAAKKYNISPNNISHVCQGLRNRKYAGKDDSGIKLQWMFVEEYNNKSKSDIDDILKTTAKKSLGYKHMVVCLDTLEVFNSIKDAKLKYNAPSISDCCRGFCNYSGYHNELKKRLRWKYYEDYLRTAVISDA